MSSESLRVSVKWEVFEFGPDSPGPWPSVPPLLRKGRLVLVRKNIMTNYGLTAFASFLQPTVTPYVQPTYMVVESLSGAIQNAGTLAVSSTSVQLDKRVDQAGDTSLVLGVGTANQETVTFSSVSGTPPTYTISATTKTHTHLDPCVRGVLVTDTMALVQSEQQYDSSNFANQRMPATGGFSPGQSQWTMQFFFSGSQALGPSQANLLFGNVGLADNLTIGQGNLHNHLALGYVHSLNNDVEIDVTFTISNN